MGLRTLKLNTSYETTEHQTQLLDEFYIPVLEQATKYFRIAGFFSSTSLSVAAKGIEGLIKNDGKMYLLISPELSAEDYKVIEKHGSIERTNFVNSFSVEFPDDNLKALAWLLDSGKLEIKIVVGINSATSLFHQKVGIIFDADGDMLSFSGSINETAQAWMQNIEEFKVFKSWESGQIEYLNSDLSKFLSYWKNEHPEIAKVFDLPTSVREKIVSIKPRNVWDLNIMRRYKKDKSIQENKLSLFPHQEKAVAAWIENNYSLLMEMATGTGKTRTAIGCILEKLKDKETLLTIIATPQNTLSRQWRADIINLGISFDREIIIDGSNTKWKKEFEMLLFDLSDRRIQNAVIYTTHATASDKKFIDIITTNKYGTKILFVCDEVHATGASKQRNALLDEYEYRIGLSATPDRMFDDEGTNLIREYFGNKSFEFTIRDALNTINPLTGKPFLNQFEYHPIFVDLTESESKQYAKLSQKIAILKSKEEYDPDELERLYDRRSRISKNAENKLSALRNLLIELGPGTITDTILFATDVQIEPSFQIMGELHIKRAKITEEESASKVVNADGDTERQEIIQQFSRHQLQVLVGIKCLDEGIDIKNARIAILMASSTNPREFVQRVGRVIRPSVGKPTSQIYDFIVSLVGTTSLLEKEGRRANYIAQNALNYDNVKKEFLAREVDISAN